MVSGWQQEFDKSQVSIVFLSVFVFNVYIQFVVFFCICIYLFMLAVERLWLWWFPFTAVKYFCSAGISMIARQSVWMLSFQVFFSPKIYSSLINTEPKSGYFFAPPHEEKCRLGKWQYIGHHGINQEKYITYGRHISWNQKWWFSIRLD